MADKNYDPRKTSVAVGGEKKKRRLLPLILGLLALLLLALIIGLLSCGGDDESESASTPSTPSTPSVSTPTAESTPTTPDIEAAPDDAGAAGAAGAGTLTAASQSLLGADAAEIEANDGETAKGSGVKVLSVSEAGFFVGTDDSDRQFVEFGGAVGDDESDEMLPAVGDVVDLEGEVRPAPKSAGTTLKLSDDEAKAVSERGAYINATSVTPSGG